ncbi:alpha/beta hydrolase [Phenylobacterium deserti]|uniref:Lipase n=1 Tax=Phenylobacterium deserti TaxID=1914756 RepID=A0A328AUI1_9CAUL|nr:alpha/beta hydrolase [Phenylobacterium deserti]RAK57945.1 lipase [Phenylobacterium deserti]
MSILDRMFGGGHDKQGDSSSPIGHADNDMRTVLETFLEMNPQPTEMLTAEAARQQPTPADAAQRILRERHLDKAADLQVLTQDIKIPGAAGDLEARIYKMHESDKLHPVVLYIHGGGWVIADLNVYDSSPRAISKFGDIIVVSVHYRQAPEHKFPAAHDDVYAAYKWIRENAQSFGGDPQRVAVVGESAGGNLALNVAIRARDEGAPAPAHVVAVYPIAAGSTDSPSYREWAEAKPLNKAMMQWFFEHYLNGPQELSDPRIDLVNADLRGLPGVTVINAEIDPLCSEGELLAERLEAQGVDVRHKTFHGVTHEFFGMGLVVKDAAAAETFAVHELKRAFGTAILPI